MKETGIIMSGNHPRLIMDKLKTMTRRTYGLSKINIEPDKWNLVAVFQDGLARFFNTETEDELTLKCPYGGVGDKLWIRETFSKRTDGVDQIMYKADYEEIVKVLELKEFTERMGYPPLHPAWKPSIHMFHKDSRADLGIIGIGAARVQGISLEDVKREGVAPYTLAKGVLSANPPDPRWKFIELWDRLNLKRGLGWDFNPWVWPITFKVIE